MSTDALTWLRGVLDAMTPGPAEIEHVILHDSQEPDVARLPMWEWELAVGTISWLDGYTLDDPTADLRGIAALRNLAPAMLAVIEAAHRFRSMVHVELHNLDDLSELGNRAEALDNAIAACLAAVREEQQRHG